MWKKNEEEDEEKKNFKCVPTLLSNFFAICCIFSSFYAKNHSISMFTNLYRTFCPCCSSTIWLTVFVKWNENGISFFNGFFFFFLRVPYTYELNSYKCFGLLFCLVDDAFISFDEKKRRKKEITRRTLKLKFQFW